MPTVRSFAKKAFRCGLYEAQDVLFEVDDVDLIHLEPGPKFQFLKRFQKKLLYHDVSGKLMYSNPGLQKVTLDREYDLFVAVCQDYWDIPYVNAVSGWKDYCKTTVCLIDEMWPASIPDYGRLLELLDRFDHVFVGLGGSVVPLSKATGRACHWFPGAVDTMGFNPYPNPPERVIDVYSIGRRWGGTHDALLRASAHGEMFYLYDTFVGASNTDVHNHREHRSMYANAAKRSRYFMVAPGKMDTREHTGGHVEIGYRYFEGAAAGAVLVGQAPGGEAFKKMFGWPDSVIEVQPDGSDIREVLAGLDMEPERVSAIGRRNAAEALSRHDWAHRWREMLRIAGIPPSPRMTAREHQLKELAELAMSATPAGGIGVVNGASCKLSF